MQNEHAGAHLKHVDCLCDYVYADFDDEISTENWRGEGSVAQATRNW